MATPTVYVRRRYKRKIRHNPISGHSWPEDTPLDMWDVDDHLGHHSSHRSKEKADEVAQELRDFYEKFPM